jgi:hypothetical protein
MTPMMAAWELERLSLGLGDHGRRIIKLAAQRGLRIERQGESWRISGPGVDVAVASPRFLDERDLRPAMPGRR